MPQSNKKAAYALPDFALLRPLQDRWKITITVAERSTAFVTGALK